MAIAYLTPSTAASFDVTLATGAASPSASETADGGNASDKYVVASCSFRDSNGHAVSGMTFNGVSMTALGAQLSGNGAAQRTYGLALGSGNLGSVTLAVNTTGGAGTQTGILSFMVFSGLDQSSSVDGYASNSGASGAAATLTVTSAVGDVPFVFATGRTAVGDISAPTNYTERIDNPSGTGGAAVTMGGGEGVGAASINFTTTFSGGFSNGWVAQGANLNVAAGGGGGAVVSPYYSHYYKSIVTGIAA